MKNALILHGTDASPSANWFQWLQTVLIENGYSVWLPQLPDSAQPNIETYNNFLLNNADFTFNEETIVIGHSSGAVEILSLLQNLPNNIKVGNVYLVSAFKDNLDWNALDGLFIEPYEYDSIQSKARSITLIHSNDDPYVSLSHAEYLANELAARLIMIPGQGHFNLEKSDDYHKFPLLAQLIEANESKHNSSKLVTFRGESVKYIDTQTVKEGVECDAYSFVDDYTKDLGIIRIKQGSKTPKQLIVKGKKTIEGCIAGIADLTVSKDSADEVIYACKDDNYGADTVLGVGDTMQWSAKDDSVCYEVCYPPYEDGRFEDQ